MAVFVWIQWDIEVLFMMTEVGQLKQAHAQGMTTIIDSAIYPALSKVPYRQGWNRLLSYKPHEY